MSDENFRLYLVLILATIALALSLIGRLALDGYFKPCILVTRERKPDDNE